MTYLCPPQSLFGYKTLHFPVWFSQEHKERTHTHTLAQLVASGLIARLEQIF